MLGRRATERDRWNLLKADPITVLRYGYAYSGCGYRIGSKLDRPRAAILSLDARPVGQHALPDGLARRGLARWLGRQPRPPDRSADQRQRDDCPQHSPD